MVKKFGSMLAVGVLIATHGAEELELEDFEIPTAFWDRTINLGGAFGYKDNILLSNSRQDQSAFWRTTADLSILRFSLENGVNFTFFASAEDRRYFSSDEVEKEQTLLGQARIEKPFAEVWKAGSSIQYFYLDQVFDASATEEIFFPLPVRAHRFGISPFVSREFPGNYTVELKFNADRQLYNRPLDDFWEAGPEIVLIKTYGNRSEAKISYALQQRDYDTRSKYDDDFLPVPGTSLQYHQHEVEGSVNHSWDSERLWRSRFRLGFEKNDDNGSGYFDYHRYRIAKRFSYHAKTWQASLEGRLLFYDYLRQPAWGTDETRSVTEYILGLRLEKNLRKNLKIYAESEHEWVRSNLRLEEYQVNTVLGGVDWEF